METTTRTLLPSAALFQDAQTDARLNQFRMRRLQVYNWGTFSGLTDVPIAERGFLFVGRSGSGKSTLLDAMSALLTPPSIVDFNAAAREAERSGRDRNLVSYVRGAWADQQDSSSGEIATQYLRKGATWTALVLTYENARGDAVSIVRLFWINGTGTTAADVRKHYMVVPRRFDIAAELDGFDLDLRKLRARLGEDVAHFDSFSGYAERFRHLLGIGNDMALRLLHKTQSAKNLGDLNGFLRGFMLDEPRTFEAADRLVEDFAELDGAHHAVVTARRQVETLAPARELHAQLMDLRRQVADLRALQASVDGFREEHRLALTEARLRDIDVKDRGLLGEEGERRQLLDNLEQKLVELERQQREQGGERVDELERERARVEREVEDRMRRRKQLEGACRHLGITLAEDSVRFAEQVEAARQVLADGGKGAGSVDEAIAERMAERRADEKRFNELRHELDSLKATPSSIPAPLQNLRTRLAEDTGIAESALPFVGELLQVRDDQIAWRGAIERVLHGFAQSLLVDERHHAQVADWVNRTHLGTRLVYFRVRDNELLHAQEPDKRSLVGKLQIRDHAYADWVYNELLRRFDYTCVDNAAQLRHQDRGLTKEGQIKHPGDRYEKDDRHAVTDRRLWMLGHDNRDKRRIYEREAQELAARIAACDADVDALRRQRQGAQQQQLAAHTLAERDWDEIDVSGRLQRIEDINEQLAGLREGDSALARIAGQINDTRSQRDQARRTYEDVRLERAQLGQERQRLEQQVQACRIRLESEGVDESQRGLLQQRLSVLPPMDLDSLESHFRVIERSLGDEIGASQGRDAKLAGQVIDCFRRFVQQWPEDSADFTVSLSSAEDFLARLTRLESDGLPRHEGRFFELLQTQSKNNLLALQRHTAEAHKAIKQRMDEVNASLEQVPFNRGTILTIEVHDRKLPDVQDFGLQLRAVLSHQQTEDRSLAESQFTILRDLVRRLGGQEPELRRWREQVLDVRQHVEFIGVELDAATREQVEIYRSGAGKSGGQRQKLATTCLAAALRYQLGGEDGELPRYAAVVLDEAFDKADNEFTALAMNIFENFGFQMVVATPLKSVMTLEPFIGGACFVEISGRHDSGVLLIEYDEEHARLKLPERVGGSSVRRVAVPPPATGEDVPVDLPFLDPPSAALPDTAVGPEPVSATAGGADDSEPEVPDALAEAVAQELAQEARAGSASGKRKPAAAAGEGRKPAGRRSRTSSDKA